ncbi:hypothetical protein JYU34_007701 [Plutella xylostella]|uniref:Plastocyanin-like domain-containing protein n=1 Tax=Plutella xylostella TaxID=51655 RepID=A0ABQ7QR56_PLUXY|nr:hypothetical protein JYU34_007701 [Plutella xylostella]
MGRSPDKNIKKINLKHALDLDRKGLLNRQYNLPPHKDTIAVPNNGYVVIRLKADNPGYWLFHCHFIFHIVIGMNLILHIGTQHDLPPVPQDFPRCGNHLPPITPLAPYHRPLGLRVRDERIIGGHEAKPNSHPYIVSLQLRFFWVRAHICGGSILTENWVSDKTVSLITS